MNEILILSIACKTVLARLSSLGRHFCDDDVNEMVSTTVSNVGVVAHRMRNQKQWEHLT